ATGAPKVNEVNERDRIISGTGAPDSDLIVQSRNHTQVVKVDKDGNFNFKSDAALRKGDTLYILCQNGSRQT
ncbi:hypothetical protein COJ07_31045, partial [Bacillus cereus]